MPADRARPSGTVQAGLILLSTENGLDRVAADRNGPRVLRVEMDSRCAEVPSVTQVFEDRLGCRLFLRQAVESAPDSATRLYVGELLDRPPAGTSWLPAPDVGTALSAVLARELGVPGAALPHYVDSVAGLLGRTCPRWQRPGWFPELRRRVVALLGDDTALRPYRLRATGYDLRAANRTGMYEIHAGPRLPAEWDMRPLVEGKSPHSCRPRRYADWPDLGAAVYEVPIGICLGGSAAPANWEFAVTRIADLQAEYAELVPGDATVLTEPAIITDRFDAMLRDWCAQPASRLGPAARSWLQQSVARSARTLQRSPLPPTLLDCALSAYTVYLHGRQLRISAWGPSCVGHPFATLAALLVSGGRPAGMSATSLARVFAEAWWKTGSVRFDAADVRAGLVVGCAMQAVAAWETGRRLGPVVLPELLPEIAKWCSVMLRNTTG